MLHIKSLQEVRMSESVKTFEFSLEITQFRPIVHILVDYMLNDFSRVARGGVLGFIPLPFSAEEQFHFVHFHFKIL